MFALRKGIVQSTYLYIKLLPLRQSRMHIVHLDNYINDMVPTPPSLCSKKKIKLTINSNAYALVVVASPLGADVTANWIVVLSLDYRLALTPEEADAQKKWQRRHINSVYDLRVRVRLVR